MAGAADTSAVLLYDGECGVCNAAVQFVLKRDETGRFRFAPLQGGFAREVLARHGQEPSDLDTMYLVLDSGTEGERLLARSEALLETCRRLGGIWAVIASIRVLPRGFLDALYGVLVRNRYRLAGRYESCPVPTPEQRHRFITG